MREHFKFTIPPCILKWHRQKIVVSLAISACLNWLSNKLQSEFHLRLDPLQVYSELNATEFNEDLLSSMCIELQSDLEIH